MLPCRDLERQFIVPAHWHLWGLACGPRGGAGLAGYQRTSSPPSEPYTYGSCFYSRWSLRTSSRTKPNALRRSRPGSAGVRPGRWANGLFFAYHHPYVVEPLLSPQRRSWVFGLAGPTLGKAAADGARGHRSLHGLGERVVAAGVQDDEAQLLGRLHRQQARSSGSARRERRLSVSSVGVGRDQIVGPVEARCRDRRNRPPRRRPRCPLLPEIAQRLTHPGDVQVNFVDRVEARLPEHVADQRRHRSPDWERGSRSGIRNCRSRAPQIFKPKLREIPPSKAPRKLTAAEGLANDVRIEPITDPSRKIFIRIKAQPKKAVTAQRLLQKFPGKIELETQPQLRTQLQPGVKHPRWFFRPAPFHSLPPRRRNRRR